jgi:hypothetical protein
MFSPTVEEVRRFRGDYSRLQVEQVRNCSALICVGAPQAEYTRRRGRRVQKLIPAYTLEPKRDNGRNGVRAREGTHGR